MKWSQFNFTSPNEINEILHQQIWLNSHIKNKKNEMIINNNMFTSGIVLISDLLINGKFATFDQIKQKYPNLTIDFLKYYGIIASIPQKWKIVINEYYNTSTLI